MLFPKLDMNFQKENCPLCGGGDFVTLCSNDRYFTRIQTVGCAKCGLIQTNPRPDAVSLKKFYEHDYRVFYQKAEIPDREYEIKYDKKKRLAAAVDFLAQNIDLSQRSNVLDIGCSEGEFFGALNDRAEGFSYYGVEPNPKFSRMAVEKYGAVIFEDLAAAQVSFDLISLTHVFEHLLDPVEVLAQIKKRLTTRGLLYIDVPDADEYDKLGDLHIAHIYHYTLRTLRLLLCQQGFEIVRIEKHSPPKHPKSIRLMARVSEAGPVSSLFDAAQEYGAWNRIKNIGVTLPMLRYLTSKVPFAKRVYRLVQKQ